MDISQESLDKYMPYYLTQEQRVGLKKAFSDFSKAVQVSYYSLKQSIDILQGDTWSAIKMFSYHDGNSTLTKCIMLSNTCDVSPENQRAMPAHAVFAPIVQINKLRQVLLGAGLSVQAVNEKIDSIMQQRTTSMFYLPDHGNLKGGYVALLDRVQSAPVEAVVSDESNERLTSLSMFGFYLFVFKLSVHFCRMHEAAERD